MTERIVHNVQTTNNRWYWSYRLDPETSMGNYWAENMKDIEWCINTEPKRESDAR